jgi:hypothetical protein
MLYDVTNSYMKNSSKGEVVFKHSHFYTAYFIQFNSH